MLLPKINKKIESTEEAYSIYIGILQAITGFKITDQEKKVLSIILKNGSLTKEVRQELSSVASKPRIENIVSKLRAKRVLIGDTPNPKFPKLGMTETTVSITLKPNEGN